MARVRTSPKERNLSDAWPGVGIFCRFSGGIFTHGHDQSLSLRESQGSVSLGKDLPRSLVHAIGIAEILGALGLILPAVTGIYSWLTPVAAIGLALLIFMAAVFHTTRREMADAALNVMLLILLVFVAYVRWPLMP